MALEESQRLFELLKSIRQNPGYENVDATNEELLIALQDRIDAVEALVEDFGQQHKLEAEVASYVEDLRKDSRQIRSIRRWAAMLTGVFSVGLFLLLVALIVFEPIWFVSVNSGLQVPLLVSLAGGAVVLVSLLLKGAFRTRSERNADEFLPDNLKTIIEALKSTEQK